MLPFLNPLNEDERIFRISGNTVYATDVYHNLKTFKVSEFAGDEDTFILCPAQVSSAPNALDYVCENFSKVFKSEFSDDTYLENRDKSESKITEEFYSVNEYFLEINKETYETLPPGYKDSYRYSINDRKMLMYKFTDSEINDESFYNDVMIKFPIKNLITAKKLNFPNMSHCNIEICLGNEDDILAIKNNKDFSPIEMTFGSDNSFDIEFSTDLYSVLNTYDLCKDESELKTEERVDLRKQFIRFVNRLDITSDKIRSVSQAFLPCLWYKADFNVLDKDFYISSNEINLANLKLEGNGELRYDDKEKVFKAKAEEVKIDPAKGIHQIDIDAKTVLIKSELNETNNCCLRGIRCSGIAVGKRKVDYKFNKVIFTQDEVDFFNRTYWSVNVATIEINDIILASGNKKLKIRTDRGVKLKYKNKIYSGNATIFL